MAGTAERILERLGYLDTKLDSEAEKASEWRSKTGERIACLEEWRGGVDKQLDFVRRRQREAEDERKQQAEFLSNLRGKMTAWAATAALAAAILASTVSGVVVWLVTRGS